jgi:hypothetical protein
MSLFLAVSVEAENLYYLHLTSGFLFGWYLFSPLDV